MANVRWRALGELLGRVRRRALQRGRRPVDWVTAVVSAVIDASLVKDEAQGVRERLAAAGLLEASAAEAAAQRRPDEADLARARAVAGRGVPVADLVTDGRR